MPTEMVLVGRLTELRTEAARMMLDSIRSVNTRRAYARDWKDFTTWCESAGLLALPAIVETLVLYAVDQMRTHKVSSVQRRMAAIAWYHDQEGHPSPYVKEARHLMEAARRERGSSPRQASALSTSSLHDICNRLWKSGDERDVRDLALVLLGFSAGGMRRSELVALERDDLQFTGKGLLVRVKRSKTDQEGQGRLIAVFKGSKPAYCPYRAVWNYIGQRGDGPGWLFSSRRREAHLTPEYFNLIVKRLVCDVGLDPSKYSAHSLRAGFITAAAENGIPETLIMRSTGHKSVQTVARYVRPVDAWRVNPLAKVR